MSNGAAVRIVWRCRRLPSRIAASSPVARWRRQLPASDRSVATSAGTRRPRGELPPSSCSLGAPWCPGPRRREHAPNTGHTMAAFNDHVPGDEHRPGEHEGQPPAPVRASSAPPNVASIGCCNCRAATYITTDMAAEPVTTAQRHGPDRRLCSCSHVHPTSRPPVKSSCQSAIAKPPVARDSPLTVCPNTNTTTEIPTTTPHLPRSNNLNTTTAHKRTATYIGRRHRVHVGL